MRAFITGITGQDGSYLAELLLDKGYEVHGLVRHKSSGGNDRIAHLQDKVVLHHGDLTDSRSLINALKAADPDEVYNLASMSFVTRSWEQPSLTMDVTGAGALRMLDAVRDVCPGARFYQASSSEMFGETRECPQTEDTPFRPRSPYGVAKCYAHWLTVNYRESYGMHASCGICFNHESERRGPEFVTRKITRAAAEILYGDRKTVSLGNLDAARDWGHAKDYVRGMWLMLQQDEPDDYVLATGRTHTVWEFAEAAFEVVGRSWRNHVVTDANLRRPAEISLLCGDATKARVALGWKPEIAFDELVADMVHFDMCRPVPA